MNESATTGTTKKPRPVPAYVWVLTALGAIAGVFLAKPGDILGNTIPSAISFAAVGFILGLAGWLVQRLVARP